MHRSLAALAALAATALATPALADECFAIDPNGWTTLAYQPAWEQATVSPVVCDETPAGTAWVIDYRYDFQPPIPHHFRVDLSDAHVNVNGTVFEPFLLWRGVQGSLPDIETRTSSTQYAHHLLTTEPPVPCGPDVLFDGVWVDTVDDTANCYVAPVPAGESGFVYDNKYYLEPTPNCAIGTYDTANCYVATAGKRTTPFVYNGNLYTTVRSDGVCPIGTFDGSNCFVATVPAGSTGFTSGLNLYTTPQYTCPYGSFDTQNCFMGEPPPGKTAFITPLVTGAFYHAY